MAIPDQISKKTLYRPALIGLGLVILSILVAMSGPIGSRFNWWDFNFAIKIVRWSAYFGIFASVLCLSGLVAARPGGKRRGFVFSLLGLAIIAPTLWYLLVWDEAKEMSPPIQDITTSTKNLPTFWNAPNYRTYGGFRTQEEFYSDIEPLILPVPADRAFDLSVEVIRKNGWKLWEPSREELHVEATEKTFWFGFNDDVVIHITEIDENSSRIDMRSASRYGGGGDGGTNANRIRAFFKALKKRSQG